MPVTPGKTPISAVTTSEQRVGVQKKRDTDLLVTTQLKYAMTMLDAKGISDKLFPCISTDTEKMAAVMAELRKATEPDRKKGMEELVLEWMPVDFLDKPKSENTEGVRASSCLSHTLVILSSPPW
jgi:hypothetical protein